MRRFSQGARGRRGRGHHPPTDPDTPVEEQREVVHGAHEPPVDERLHPAGVPVAPGRQPRVGQQQQLEHQKRK
jgi:hypothetical protein